MDNHVRLAISKVKDDGVRDNVAPGEYNIDATIRIRGNLVVGEDYERATSTVLPHTEVLAYALHLAGIQQDRAISIIRDSVKACLTNGESAVGKIRDNIPTIEAEINRIKQEIVNQLPKQQCKGNVKFALTTIESVEGDKTIQEANDILRELMG
jgi:hypothetical protein